MGSFGLARPQLMGIILTQRHKAASITSWWTLAMRFSHCFPRRVTTEAWGFHAVRPLAWRKLKATFHYHNAPFEGRSTRNPFQVQGRFLPTLPSNDAFAACLLA